MKPSSDQASSDSLNNLPSNKSVTSNSGSMSQANIVIHQLKPQPNISSTSSLNIGGSIPHSSSGEYIVYLEPDPSTRLHQQIIEFYRQSKQELGPNEAHMYHPHTSLTGFFHVNRQTVDAQDDIKDSSSAESNSEMDKQVKSVLEKIIDMKQSEPPLSLPIVETIRKDSESLYIPIRLSQEWHQLMNTFKQRLIKEFNEAKATCDVRVKPMDHISLAYVKTTSLRPQLSTEELDRLHELSRKLITDTSDTRRWRLCLYRVEGKSQSVNQKHLFQCLYSHDLMFDSSTIKTIQK